jgi:hypothetical protein
LGPYVPTWLLVSISTGISVQRAARLSATGAVGEGQRVPHLVVPYLSRIGICERIRQEGGGEVSASEGPAAACRINIPHGGALAVSLCLLQRSGWAVPGPSVRLKDPQ